MASGCNRLPESENTQPVSIPEYGMSKDYVEPRRRRVQSTQIRHVQNLLGGQNGSDAEQSGGAARTLAAACGAACNLPARLKEPAVTSNQRAYHSRLLPLISKRRVKVAPGKLAFLFS